MKCPKCHRINIQPFVDMIAVRCVYCGAKICDNFKTKEPETIDSKMNIMAVLEKCISDYEGDLGALSTHCSGVRFDKRGYDTGKKAIIQNHKLKAHTAITKWAKKRALIAYHKHIDGGREELFETCLGREFNTLQRPAAGKQEGSGDE